MAHEQKPDFVFRRNGRVHLKRRGRQFSRLLVAEVCASAAVMLDTPSSEVVKGTGYPPHSPVSPSLRLPCVTVCHNISTGLYDSRMSASRAPPVRAHNILTCHFSVLSRTVCYTNFSLSVHLLILIFRNILDVLQLISTNPFPHFCSICNLLPKFHTRSLKCFLPKGKILVYMHLMKCVYS